MDMQHIQEFEGFSGEPGSTLLLGFYGEGGHGSHPAILTPSELSKCGFIHGPGQLPRHMMVYSDEGAKRVWSHTSDPMINFHILHQLPAVPKAICCWMEDSNWKMEPVDVLEAEAIKDEVGSDTVYQNNPLFPRAAALAGLDDSSLKEVYAISFITNPLVNSVYWSDNPESSHGHWQDGRPIPLSELAS